VTSVAKGDAWPAAKPATDIDEPAEPEVDMARKCGEAIPSGEGQRLAGVIKPVGEDCGVGSKLPGWLRARLTGGNGHTTVRHAVVGTLCGVTIGFDPGDAAGPGADVQDDGALRAPCMAP